MKNPVLNTLVLACMITNIALAQSKPVLVAGATGQTGKLVVQALLADGLPVRAMTRNPDKAAAFSGGIEGVVGDATDPASLTAAMQGVGIVISTIGARFPIGDNGFAAVDWEGNRALIDAAKAAGVDRFILLSAGSAGRDGFPYSWSISPYPWKAKSEQYLRDSGMSYAILAAGGLRDYAAGEQAIKLAPRSEYEGALISRADLANVLVACATEAACLGKTITIVNQEDVAPTGAWRASLAGLPKDP
jgi:uncharacterized protein YbjT (DUF2867 family)